MLLITNGGDHSAETLAVHTAEQLLPGDLQIVRQHELAAGKLRLALGEALVPHHAAVQAAPHPPVGDEGHAEALKGAVDAAWGAVKAAAAGTPFEKHFAGAEAERRARSILSTHFNTASHNARDHAG